MSSFREKLCTLPRTSRARTHLLPLSLGSVAKILILGRSLWRCGWRTRMVAGSACWP